MPVETENVMAITMRGHGEKVIDLSEGLPEQPLCTWTFVDPDIAPRWETSCEQAFSFTEGGVEENGFLFCPWCGCTIEPVIIPEPEICRFCGDDIEGDPLEREGEVACLSCYNEATIADEQST